MTSKERLEAIRKQLEKTCIKDCGHGSNENCICLNNQYANLEHLEKDLEMIELLKKCYYASSIDDKIYKTSYGFDNPQDTKKIKEWMDYDK